MSHGPAHPTDPQIAHIAYTAGLIDIAAGKQALARSKNPTVRAFAQEMIRDHTAVNDKALALVKKLGVTPEANATSRSLEAGAKVQARKLGALRGAAFDRAYIRNEVAYHRTVNGALRAGPFHQLLHRPNFGFSAGREGKACAGPLGEVKATWRIAQGLPPCPGYRGNRKQII